MGTGFDVSDYCLAQLVEFDDGEYEWQCKDNNLVQDGVHFSGLVQNTDGVFIIMKKPGVCHNYRGFSDQQVEFIMLGRAIPETKRSDAVLTYFAKSTYFFAQDCLNNDFQKELATFPIQLGYETPKPVAIPEPCLSPECACNEDDDDGGDGTPLANDDDDSDPVLNTTNVSQTTVQSYCLIAAACAHA